jgi:hypothetical protein
MEDFTKIEKIGEGKYLSDRTISFIKVVYDESMLVLKPDISVFYRYLWGSIQS